MKKSIILTLGASAVFVAGLANQSVQAEDKVAAMYRFYNPNSGEHFYTANEAEAENLAKVRWVFEGIGWFSLDQGQDVYRLYNPNAGDHHYTLDAAERDALVQAGWKYEGVSWKSTGKISLYRLYNPNAKAAGSHHYTPSEGERDSLVASGWKFEGVAWNAIEKGLTVDEIKAIQKEQEAKTQPSK